MLVAIFVFTSVIRNKIKILPARFLHKKYGLAFYLCPSQDGQVPFLEVKPHYHHDFDCIELSQ